MKLTMFAVVLGIGLLTLSMTDTVSAQRQRCDPYTGPRCPPNQRVQCTPQPNNAACHCRCQPQR